MSLACVNSFVCVGRVGLKGKDVVITGGLSTVRRTSVGTANSWKNVPLFSQINRGFGSSQSSNLCSTTGVVSKSGETIENSKMIQTPTIEEFVKRTHTTKGTPSHINIDKLKAILDTTNAIDGPPGSRRVFEETTKFPTKFMIKIVGMNEPTFVSDMLSTVAVCLDQSVKQDFEYSLKETAGGKYVSLTINPLFATADELYATYAAIGKDTRVKMTL